jgi:hypothetical protein
MPTGQAGPEIGSKPDQRVKQAEKLALRLAADSSALFHAIDINCILPAEYYEAQFTVWWPARAPLGQVHQVEGQVEASGMRIHFLSAF